MRKAITAAFVAAFVLTGCGETGAGTNAVDARNLDESAVPEASETPEPTPSPTEGESGDEPDDPADADDPNDDAIEVEIEDGRITPTARRVTVKAGEPVMFNVESDRPGELHVHSSPEEVLPFGKGTTTLEVVIDRPGVVDVEEHEAGVVVVRLEVT